MDIWWDSLATPLRVFYAIAIATSFLMLLQLAAMLLGLGDGDMDVDGDAGLDDAGGGGHVLSVRTITAFFVGFGWTGVAALKAGVSLPLTLVLALFVGGLFLAGVLVLMRALYGLRHSGTLDYRNAVGTVGRVYLRVPASMKGPGQVEVTVQGRLRTVQAFTHSSIDLPNQTRIRVVDVMDQNTLVVEPFESTAETTTQEG